MNDHAAQTFVKEFQHNVPKERVRISNAKTPWHSGVGLKENCERVLDSSNSHERKTCRKASCFFVFALLASLRLRAFALRFFQSLAGDYVR
jgi:hypothetical protein